MDSAGKAFLAGFVKSDIKNALLTPPPSYSPQEDLRLRECIEAYGRDWTKVAARVVTRTN
jgi:hypothetical protein